MFAINIDLASKIQEFSLDTEEVRTLSNYLLDRVVDEVMAKWEDVVGRELDSTRSEYKKGMYSERPDDTTAIIGLTARDSKLAMMIEVGASVFDEKEGFSKSKNIKHKKDGGWYLTVPFRHATADAIMSQMVPGKGISVIDLMKSGDTLKANNLPEGYNEAQVHSLELNTGSILSYQHKNPIYEGMKRFDISSTDKEKRGEYMTFRRVSDNSDEQSWIHPGFESYDLMGKALTEAQLPAVIGDAIQEFLDTKFG